jgi:hypothetical protein
MEYWSVGKTGGVVSLLIMLRMPAADGIGL